jgi:hypothetical protein
MSGGQRSAGKSGRRLHLAFCASIVCELAMLAGCAPRPPKPVIRAPGAAPPVIPVAPAPSAPVNKPPAAEGVSLYFPHRLGDSWQMVMKGDAESEKLDLSIATGGPGSDPNRFYLITRRGSEVVGRDGYAADEKGLNFVSSGVPDLTRMDPPMPILRLPVVSGDKWDWKGKFRSAAGDLDADATFSVAGPDRIETPAGIFDAFRVEQKVVVHASPDVTTTTTMWLAPNVGLVKQVVESPDHKGEALLSAYKVQKY